jgi:hypothetical protein
MLLFVYLFGPSQEPEVSTTKPIDNASHVDGRETFVDPGIKIEYVDRSGNAISERTIEDRRKLGVEE